MSDTASALRPARLRKLAIEVAIWLVIGVAIGATVARYDLLDGLKPLDPFLGLALLLGAILAIVGANLVAVSYRPVALGQVLDGDRKQVASAAERTFYRLGGWVILLAGLLAALPPAAVLVAEPLPRAAAWTVFASVVLLSGLQFALNVRLWRKADELTRRATTEGACLALLVVEGLLFLWAAAEVFGLAPAASAWAIWTLTFVAYVVTCTCVSWRRGLT